MSQIKQVIRLHQGGSGIKTIARDLGMSKNTVKAYLKKTKDGALDINMLLKQEDPVVEKAFHAGNPAYKSKNFEHLKTRLDYFEKELKRIGVTKKLLWDEYIENYPQGYSYPQFNFHLWIRQLQVGKSANQDKAPYHSKPVAVNPTGIWRECICSYLGRSVDSVADEGSDPQRNKLR